MFFQILIYFFPLFVHLFWEQQSTVSLKGVGYSFWAFAQSSFQPLRRHHIKHAPLSCLKCFLELLLKFKSYFKICSSDLWLGFK